MLSFRGDLYQMKNYSDEKKLMTDIRLHDELNENYKIISKLALVALRRSLRLVIENPIAEQHYLKRYWCLKPAIIDHDRTQNGDYYKKPTQYYFIGMEPKHNIIFEPMDYVPRRRQQYVTSKDGKSRAVRRSEIHPQYARRFIRQYLIETEEPEEEEENK